MIKISSWDPSPLQLTPFEFVNASVSVDHICCDLFRMLLIVQVEGELTRVRSFDG